MPRAKSKSQQRLFFALANRGEISKATAKRHARKGKSFKALPNKVRRKKRG